MFWAKNFPRTFRKGFHTIRPGRAAAESCEGGGYSGTDYPLENGADLSEFIANFIPKFLDLMTNGRMSFGQLAPIGP